VYVVLAFSGQVVLLLIEDGHGALAYAGRGSQLAFPNRLLSG
jgi:hypothetical protein